MVEHTVTLGEGDSLKVEGTSGNAYNITIEYNSNTYTATAGAASTLAITALHEEGQLGKENHEVGFTYEDREIKKISSKASIPIT